MKNRSVPTDIILPHIVYQDVPDAITWLSNASGFTEHYRYGTELESIGAQIHLGDAWFMLETAKPGTATPKQLGAKTQSLTIFIDDVDAHFQKAKLAGVTIVEEPHVTIYGEHQYAAIDLEGHHWLFSQHAQDVSPDAWGAQIATR
jgi:uncharacterized glyoxalase superfamily protein PhnB